MTYLVKFLYEPLHIFSAIIHVLTKILHRKKYYFNMILDYATTFSGRLNETRLYSGIESEIHSNLKNLFFVQESFV